MKTMNIFIRVIIIMLFGIIPTWLNAQVENAYLVEKRPDPSVPSTKYSETPDARRQAVRVADPMIAAMVSAINVDTLRATLQEMQNWGSRFLMNENKKEIAISIMNKFLSYGYTDVKLDSFYLSVNNWGGTTYSSWQYNIICTLTGSSAPDEIYVAGGHWDSYCSPDPYNDAPGVDDNGTAIAATLEIARIMKQFDYRPEATIQFSLFAAEELGLYGSRYSSGNARIAGDDIRFMLNLDMISNNPSNLAKVKVYQYLNFEWAGNCAADAIERYTDLSVDIPGDKMNSGSDSYPYWLKSFPATYFEEITFSPNWHKSSDTLGNCNVPYFRKVTGGALATLAEQQQVPYPQELHAQSTMQDIVLHWKPTKNNFVKGVNVYRSEIAGSQYQKITSSPVADSTYNDLMAEQNKQYYYVITTVSDSLQESLFSREVSGARFNFSDTLLVLANLKGTKTTPDSVRAFYNSLLDIPYKWKDINAVQKINMSLISRYRSILWISNTSEFESVNDEMTKCVLAHISNGGNILFAGFTPARFWMSPTIPYPNKVPETALFHQLFKVDSNDRKIQSMLFRANTVLPDYDTLYIDSLKYMDILYRGQIYNVDVFAPAPEATVIYRFDSRFDSSTPFGKLKNRPVGLEYMGVDHKSILLSFPLYYLDTSDARDFLHYVLTSKFDYPVGITPTSPAQPFALHVFPNPAKDACNITFKLDQPGSVRLSLVSQNGKLIATWLESKLEMGTHYFRFNTSSLAPGSYNIVLYQGEARAVSKIILFH